MTNRDYFPAGVNHKTASDLNQQPPVQELPLPEGDDQSTQSQNQLDSGVENSDNSQQSDEDEDSELEQQQQAVEDPIPDDDPIPQGPRRSTRDRQARSVFVPTMTGQTHYEINNLATQGKPTTTLEYSTEETKVLAMIFAQVYSLNAGLKKFGAKGKAAAYVEMKQLHDRTCWKPVHIKDLTPAQRKKAMESLIFLTEKRDGRIKARTCANGSKQRLWMSKDEAASPTVMLESLFLSACIDAKEGREVAVIDIPNAFIQTLNEKLNESHETDIMKIRGALADMLVEMDPEMYAPYLVNENGVSLLYVEILKALYGMIKSPLLFYRKLRKDLEADGFTINPYDPCVANKIVDGKQFTVLWHVDDMKASHVSTQRVDQFIDWARDKYEDAEITK